MNNDTSRLRRPASNRKRRNQPRAPSPSVAEPRRPLLLAVLAFVLAARACPGVQRISLLGSILTAKAIPKDVDVLVTIDAAMDLTRLARSGRRLMGQAQTINLGADIFLADTTTALPWPHLPLSRMPSTCSPPRPALRAAGPS